MNNENEIISAALADIIKSAFEKTMEGIARVTNDTYKKIFEDFDPYMRDCFKKNRYVRILCNGDADIDIEQIYVGSRLKNRSKQISDQEFFFRAGSGENIVVVGNGGAGKTFLLRKLWLELFSEGKKVPIFVELRKINTSSTTDLIPFIKASISHGANISDSLFRSFCESGKFTFILDGFDEVLDELQSGVQESINKMASIFPECGYIISSRLDSRFSGWQSFSVLEALPFTLEQTRALCSRVPFDKKFRGLFVKKLTKDFFAENESFLSNPLLAIMMMMTFKDNMDIPKKIGIFYDQAFNTLYQWHDSTKVYNRKKLLDIQQFRKSFGVFCLLSYNEGMFEFTRTEVIDKIKLSNEINGFSFDPEVVLSDYEKKVNLLKQDGLRYVFVHRSFQEYFAAFALTSIFPDKMGEVLRVLMRRHADNVIKMAYDLQKNLVIKSFIGPLGSEISSRIAELESTHPEARFNALHASEVELIANFSNSSTNVSREDSKVSEFTLSSVSWMATGDVDPFIRVVSHLRGEGEKADFSGVLMSRVINLLISPQRAWPQSGISSVSMRFEPNQINFSVNQTPDAARFSTGRDDVIDLKSLEVMFERRSGELMDSIKEATQWALKEFKADSKRSKTLNEVLGLT